MQFFDDFCMKISSKFDSIFSSKILLNSSQFHPQATDLNLPQLFHHLPHQSFPQHHYLVSKVKSFRNFSFSLCNSKSTLSINLGSLRNRLSLFREKNHRNRHKVRERGEIRKFFTSSMKKHFYGVNKE